MTDYLKLLELENEYWSKQGELQKIADSLGTTVKNLMENPRDQDLDTLYTIQPIVEEQVDLLRQILNIKKRMLLSQGVVDLSSYRKLVRTS